MPRKTVLVAANPGVRNVISDALAPLDPVLAFCHSVEEAESFLRYQPCHLIICTLQFDGSRWADLLRVAKANPASNAAPFLILKISQGLLSDSLIDSSLKSAKLIGASETINLAAWRRELGNEQAYRMLRDLICTLW